MRSFDFVPKEMEIIRDNRDYFRRYTVDKLDTRVNGSLGHTDGAVYVDNTRFRDKYRSEEHTSELQSRRS